MTHGPYKAVTWGKTDRRGAGLLGNAPATAAHALCPKQLSLRSSALQTFIKVAKEGCQSSIALTLNPPSPFLFVTNHLYKPTAFAALHTASPRVAT